MLITNSLNRAPSDGNELRVIGSDNTQLGVMPRAKALQLAADEGLDLVIVAKSSSPRVARIIDRGKYNYQREKKQQRNKKASKASELKQMRFGLKIGDHDMNVKLTKVKKFIDSGYKVRLTVIMKGREMAHKDLAFELANRVVETLGDIIVVDQQPSLSGRQVSLIVRNSGNA